MRPVDREQETVAAKDKKMQNLSGQRKIWTTSATRSTAKGVNTSKPMAVAEDVENHTITCVDCAYLKNLRKR